MSAATVRPLHRTVMVWGVVLLACAAGAVLEGQGPAQVPAGAPTPATSTRLQRWDDVPGPGEDMARADEAIWRHVVELVDELLRRSREP